VRRVRGITDYVYDIRMNAKIPKRSGVCLVPGGDVVVDFKPSRIIIMTKTLNVLLL